MTTAMKYFLINLFVITSISASIINVPTDAATIQSGIDLAVNGDTVLVQVGTYNENINFKGKQIVVASTYILSSDYSDVYSTIINGGNSGSAVTFNSGENQNSSLIGISITNGLGGGLPDFTGGGITCTNGSSPTLKNLIITQNNTSDNFGRGGGIYCKDKSSPKIVDCEIIENKAHTAGGGVYLDNESNPIIKNVSISQNISNSRGGGIYCTSNSNPEMFRVLISDNIASGEGGGIYSVNSDPVFVNVTVANNQAIEEGGGIYCDGSNPVGVNNIFWGNSPTQIFLFPDVVPSSFTTVYSAVQNSWEGEGNINVDPLFVNVAEKIYDLTSGSPCIDAGVAFYISNGDTLINLSAEYYAGSAPDMGYFEEDLLSSLENDEIHFAFNSYQNYPNPFNPATTIKFTIPSNKNGKPSTTKLVVFDVLGREVATLVNKKLKPGNYEAAFDGSDLSSGVFFYTISNGSIHQTKKMILIK